MPSIFYTHINSRTIRPMNKTLNNITDAIDSMSASLQDQTAHRFNSVYG